MVIDWNFIKEIISFRMLTILGALILGFIFTVPAFAVDHIPPVLLEAEGTSKTSVRISFSEALNKSSAESRNNYTISPPLNITGAILQSDHRLVLLTTTHQTMNLRYNIEVQGVKDLDGNLITAGSNVDFLGFSPHGRYLDDPNMCSFCHKTHTAAGKQLINQSNSNSLCYVCHDSAGQSDFVVNNNFSLSSHHPVIEGVLNCVSCHNPHGDKKVGGDIYPRLLNAKIGATAYMSGNGFCFACHGSFNQEFDKPNNPNYNYYTATLGDHSNPEAAHYDESKSILLPASGTRVTCLKCHQQHGSAKTRLLIADEENLCFICHNEPANSRSGINIQSQFSRSSRHNISDVDQADGSKVECSSCHGSHTVSVLQLNETNTTSDLGDPNNTKKVFTSNPSATGRVTIGTMSDFCLKCHDGNPPNAVSSLNTFVPYTITWPNTTVTTNGGGWGDKSLYYSSGHKGKGITCAACHQPHGADYSYLQRYPEDTATTEGACLRCHDGSFSGAANIKTSLNNSAKHPTLTISGKHSNTEEYNDMASAERHAECNDCHDPHAATSAGSTKPNANGYVANVSGVQLTSNPDDRPAWTSLAKDSPAYTFIKSINKGYEVCYKCHTTYSYGPTPPTNQWDIARDFNPNNPSYHSIEAQGKNFMNWTGTNPLNYSANSFVSVWTASSVMVCTDCHGDSASTLKGVHGSDVEGILEAPYNTDTGLEESNDTDLCFRCHAWSTYQDRGGNDNTGFYNSSRGNLHTDRHDLLPCMTCHVAVPHGSKRERLIAYQGDGMPLTNSAAKIISWTQNTRDYTQANCTTTTGCHD